MKSISLNIILFSVVLFVSCNTASEYKGYTQTSSGLYYKLNVIGEGNVKPKQGDYLQLTMVYKTYDDSVFFDSYTANGTGMVLLKVSKPTFKGSFEEHLINVSEGDELSFLVNTENIFKYFFKSPVPDFLKNQEYIKVEIKLHKILNQQQYEAELLNYNQILQDRDIEEQKKIRLFVDTSSVAYTLLKSGIYYLPITQGVGSLPESGDAIAVHYIGSFLNGKIFESTYQRGQPLEYICGEQGQVIKGLELAINLMNEGAKAKFIIPSYLAYGANGSSTGIIPPYTTVVYEIELKSLTKK